MAVGDYIEEELRDALELLELANLEAIRAKQQLGRVIGEDFQVGAEIRLIPYLFWIGSNRFRAMVTHEQSDAIRNAPDGSIHGVIKVVTAMLNNELYSGAYLALQILVLALANQPLPKFAGGPIDPARLRTRAGSGGGLNPVGACQFASGCSQPYGATLCESQGGVWQSNPCNTYPTGKDRRGGGGDDGAKDADSGLEQSGE